MSTFSNCLQRLNGENRAARADFSAIFGQFFSCLRRSSTSISSYLICRSFLDGFDPDYAKNGRKMTPFMLQFNLRPNLGQNHLNLTWLDEERLCLLCNKVEYISL